MEEGIYNQTIPGDDFLTVGLTSREYFWFQKDTFRRISGFGGTPEQCACLEKLELGIQWLMRSFTSEIKFLFLGVRIHLLSIMDIPVEQILWRWWIWTFFIHQGARTQICRNMALYTWETTVWRKGSAPRPDPSFRVYFGAGSLGSTYTSWKAIWCKRRGILTYTYMVDSYVE